VLAVHFAGCKIFPYKEITVKNKKNEAKEENPLPPLLLTTLGKLSD
jgi:hypothetical protein